MGDFWEEIVNDPIGLDLLVILSAGFYGFDADARKLTCLPSLIGSEDRPASPAEIREILLPLLLSDDPNKRPSDKNLSLNSRLNLTLFRVDGESKPKTRKGSQELAGRLQKPAAPLSVDAVRKRPSKAQPRGGLEWKHLLDVRHLVIDWAQREGKTLPADLVGVADRGPSHSTADAPLAHTGANDDHENPPTKDGVKYSRTEPWQILSPTADFFDRESGEDYVRLLDGARSVTIYVGAGVSADLGAPLSDQLMRFLLRAWAGGHDFLRGLPEENRKSEPDPRAFVLEQVVEALRNAYPPAYIGSIVRSLADRNKHQDEAPDGELIQQIEHATREGVDTGGFLARSVVALAFALKRAEVDIRVLTTNYDPTMTRPEERRKVVNYFAQYFEDCDYAFAVSSSARDADSFTPSEIPLAFLNGVGPHEPRRDRDAPVIGEADFFMPGLSLPATASDYMQWREQAMTEALSADACLFVGSSLSDPDVLRALALTRGKGPRYAIVLAPDREERPGGGRRLELTAADEDTAKVARALARDLVCQRYLHLGVEPIMVDHPYQVPQLLTELALKRLEPNYDPYRQRLNKWWGKVATSLGFEVDGSAADQRPREHQERWRELLFELKEEIRSVFASGAHPEGEQIMVEVWVHNPKEHQLFLWATSESLWLYNDTAHQCGIEEEDSRFGQQGAFRDGRPRIARIKPQRGRWKFHASIPLTLHGHQWHHLPVGVVSVLSSEENGWLYSACQGKENLEKLEALIQEPINNKLDPEGALDD